MTEAYYKDVSRKPKDGDEFFELAWVEQPSFTLEVVRGIVGDKDSHKKKSYTFDTAQQLNAALAKHRNEMVGRGFRHYTPGHEILFEGKPLH